MIDITPLLNAFIALLAAIITAFLIPWIKRKTTEAQRSEMAAWVEIAVKSTEQIMQGTKIGLDRKERALSFLRDRGYDLDDEETAAQVEALIEAFVLELKRTETVKKE